MKINWKTLFICLLIPLAVGAIAGFFTKDAMDTYNTIQKPSINPPSSIFPVVWSILYILMGISSYLVVTSDATYQQKEAALRIYALQLGVNFLWPFLFFNMSAYFLAFLWLVILWFLILAMILSFSSISKLAAVLQLPYLLWVSFAGYLNYMIYQLNK